MVDIDDIRRAYDELADGYLEERSTSDLGMELLEPFLESLPAQALVLDAGCGPGRPVLTRLSDDPDVSAVGIDLSRVQLELAAANAPNASLAQGDMTSLPVQSESFDAAVAYWSLIHVPMDDHPTVLEEFARVLRPGGRVLLCEGTTEWVGENPDWLERGVHMQWDIAGPEKARAHLQDAGFSIVDVWGGPSSLATDRADEDDDNGNGEDGDDDAPWTFFEARLEG
ncbi:class I SAM-dependent methyltransferase [Natronosalvus vescus]|uniref:class I SAM-dependent methyltransferase n=1 Tax=Natronosalvus vescus TaxID=2953881 RepID=UPI00209166AA|nr:class I SAM-dependent methyltransferase [Natronosalvus vescus]